jgi:hypothetical protein
LPLGERNIIYSVTLISAPSDAMHLADYLEFA